MFASCCAWPGYGCHQLAQRAQLDHSSACIVPRRQASISAYHRRNLLRRTYLDLGRRCLARDGPDRQHHASVGYADRQSGPNDASSTPEETQHVHVALEAPACSPSPAPPGLGPPEATAIVTAQQTDQVFKQLASTPSPLPPAKPSKSAPRTHKRRGSTRKPIKIVPALIAIAVGVAVKWLVPVPAATTPEAWTLFAFFCTTVAGLMLEPLPVGAWSLCCLTALLSTKAITFHQAMLGMTNDAIWLIVFAFFFAKGFEKTGLGERIANMFVTVVGHSTLGLAYSLCFAEALVAPALPSSTARAGGIFMPVIKFLSLGAESEPTHQRKRLGAFLVHTQFQASAQVAALFMTGAAQNILSMNIARQMGVIIPDAWMTWFAGAVVPALLGLATIPVLVYKLLPPDMKATPEAPSQAQERLAQMGPPSRDEVVTLSTLAVAVVLWIFGDQLKLPAVVSAMIALASLLVTGVLTWRDCLDYGPAWDTLMWFSILVSLCSALSASNLVDLFAAKMSLLLSSFNMHWMQVFFVLHLVFFFIHYLFASQVGHVGALYAPFLAMMLGAGVPTTLAALSLGYNANLFGAITHFASGPAAVYYGSNYMEAGEVFMIGALMGLRSLLTWGVIGMVWWKALGWF